MLEVGRICTKIAGREAGGICIVVEVIDKNYCLVDGQVRRKKCNATHLDPLDKKIDISKGASHDAVVSALKKLGIEVKEKVKKEKKPQEQKAPKEEEVGKKEQKKEKVKKAKKHILD